MCDAWENYAQHWLNANNQEPELSFASIPRPMGSQPDSPSDITSDDIKESPRRSDIYSLANGNLDPLVGCDCPIEWHNKMEPRLPFDVPGGLTCDGMKLFGDLDLLIRRMLSDEPDRRPTISVARNELMQCALNSPPSCTVQDTVLLLRHLYVYQSGYFTCASLAAMSADWKALDGMRPFHSTLPFRPRTELAQAIVGLKWSDHPCVQDFYKPLTSHPMQCMDCCSVGQDAESERFKLL